MNSGASLIDPGMTRTEEIYSATSYSNVDSRVRVTSSHNPINYNGMKLVKAQSKPISGDTGLFDIQTLAESQKFEGKASIRGSYQQSSTIDPYVEQLLTYINLRNIKPLRLVVSFGNGAAGYVIDALDEQFLCLDIPIEFIKINQEPDGSFPNGIPNPLLVENRQVTTVAVIKYNADMGIAW